MEHLKQEQVSLLMQIVSDQYPNQQVLHLSDGENDLHKYLFEMTKTRGFEYDLRLIGEGAALPFDPSGHPACTVEPLDLNRKAYNKHARLYEYVFVTVKDSILQEDIVQILKKIFRLMKNSGVLVILPEKGGTLQVEIDRILEEGYFVAINHIDIFDRLDVVNARKMHGWGAYSVGF